MNTKNYNKGDVIFCQGDAADSMFDIIRGSVGVYLDYGTEKEKKLTELPHDSFFGEMGMIDHAPRSATAVALENRTQLLEITEGDLGALMREKPGRVLAIMRQLSTRLRDLTGDYMEACRTAADVVKMEEDAAALSTDEEAEIKARAERCANAVRQPEV